MLIGASIRNGVRNRGYFDIGFGNALTNAGKYMIRGRYQGCGRWILDRWIVECIAGRVLGP